MTSSRSEALAILSECISFSIVAETSEKLTTYIINTNQVQTVYKMAVKVNKNN